MKCILDLIFQGQIAWIVNEKKKQTFHTWLYMTWTRGGFVIIYQNDLLWSFIRTPHEISVLQDEVYSANVVTYDKIVNKR
jgi:hypothetical protein